MIRRMLVLLAALAAARQVAAAAKGEWQLAHLGSAAGENLGFSVTSAGDFDADGYEDLIVGSPYDSTLASSAGRATILFGGTDPAARPPRILLGDAAADDHFGISVAGGGDLDGDGYPDVAVGARFNDRGASDGGAVFVFFGGPGADGVADRVLVGTLSDDWFGESVAIVADIDGDGDDELLVGAPYNDDLQSAAGRAVLYRGGPGLGTASLVCYGDVQSNAHFGWSVAAAGDVDGDGRGDWMVGARLYGAGLDRARGRAYVFLGGPGADGVADRIFTGERKDDWFGQEVAGLGDLDGDGYDEVGVGAIYWDRISGANVVSAVGRAYVFRGGTGTQLQPLAMVEGADQDDQLGFALAGPLWGPWSARPAWVVGAHFADTATASAAGEIVVLTLDGAGTVRRLLVSDGDAPDDQWGHDVAVLAHHLAGAPAYAGTAPYTDELGDGSGKVERAVPRCLELSFESKTAVVWTACGPYAAFGLLEGSSSGGFAGMACAGAGPQPPLFTTQQPSVGETLLYLVAGEDTGNQPGSAGYGSDGVSRAVAPCP